MKTSKVVVWLSWLIAALALVAAGIGLFYTVGGHSFSFTTLRGQIVQVYGQGLYHYDTTLAVGNRAGVQGSRPGQNDTTQSGAVEGTRGR